MPPKLLEKILKRPAEASASQALAEEAENALRQAPTGLAGHTPPQASAFESSAAPSRPPATSRVRRPPVLETAVSHSNAPSGKFRQLTRGGIDGTRVKLPRRYLVRTAAWDVAAILSLLVNAVLAAVVLLLAVRLNTLQNTVAGLLGGLYDNFVRMDRSHIVTTIAVQDMPIPLDFTLPVVQEQTNVTLTQDVTIRNAYVVITTGAVNINSPATVTLPAGTTLPVSLRMDVPVQTTVLVDLQVPVNIELANAISSDPAVANLHTAFLGLQDTIGPLVCLLQPAALDYLAVPLCSSQGDYLRRSPGAP